MEMARRIEWNLTKSLAVPTAYGQEALADKSYKATREKAMASFKMAWERKP